MSSYDSAERERRRKERERAAIRSEINGLNARISSANQLISDFASCNGYITESMSQWSNAYFVYAGNEMASKVVVTDRFEGCIAEKIAAELPESLKSMDAAKASMDNVRAGVGNQMSKLREYVNRLQDRVSALWARYNSI